MGFSQDGQNERGNIIYLHRKGRKIMMHAEKTLEKYQLPKSLVTLMAIESAFDSSAVSEKGAFGIWQILDVVAKEFNKLIPNSELHFIDKCGHAPMMEVPDEFNVILLKFLKKLSEPATVG